MHSEMHPVWQTQSREL